MSISTQRATLDDLRKVNEKAELIGGRVVTFMSTGRRPSKIASRIFMSLFQYSELKKIGEAYNDNLGYTIPELPSGRESFSPAASYYVGPFPPDEMDFIQGPPTFAVEVRSKNDYGNAAEDEMAAKRTDCFQAGTEVVWDVDPIAETVTVYRATQPNQPTIYRRGDIAEANPAVPGWSITCDDIFAI
jgi:Uma2 family endonuclease